MLVNEDDEAFVLHLTKNSNLYTDTIILFPEGSPSHIDDFTISTSERATDLDQQSKYVHSGSSFQSIIPIGSTVWYATSKKREITMIIENNACPAIYHPSIKFEQLY